MPLTILIGPRGTGKTTWAKKNTCRPRVISDNQFELNEWYPSGNQQHNRDEVVIEASVWDKKRIKKILEEVDHSGLQDDRFDAREDHQGARDDGAKKIILIVQNRNQVPAVVLDESQIIQF